ncbi:unnamed protein product [Medioppia subpectinata]|uniref:G-protein coupled receptors family 1 profile domain-containing protein n=1 Tax=Medioppia subpectinata TaxID=1979941 RepID=A0A7R9Q5Q2_9ACAR|nr:unnamed protein product [Medioppia subpectinata]CAG2113574.1 unnamed protein product [Medioppia subpectinata]
MVFGIATNSVIIFVMVFNKKLMTSNILLLLNLFVSDMLLCIFCMPFTLLSLIRRSWPFGAFMCKSIPFLQAVSIFVSAGTITSIAFDRMFQITAKHFTGKSSVKCKASSKYGYITLIIWLVSVALASPIAVYQEVVEYGIPGLFTYSKCVENWPNNHKSIYSLTILFAQLLIPNAVMLVSHYRITRFLRSHRFAKNPILRNIYNNPNNNNHITLTVDKTEREEMISSETPTYTLSTSAANTCYTSTTEVHDRRYIDREVVRNNRITIFLLTITVLFGISWLPWNVFNVLADFMAGFDVTAQHLYLILAVCHLIAMSSATTNAIFYGFLHTTIKHDITRRVKRVTNIFV